MRAKKANKSRAGPAVMTVVVMRLYIADAAPNSVKAIATRCMAPSARTAGCSASSSSAASASPAAAVPPEEAWPMAGDESAPLSGLLVSRRRARCST